MAELERSSILEPDRYAGKELPDGEESVTALIEVKVSPQTENGYERIAERIYRYSEVESVYLMSGAFDFTVIITGRTLREVASFVASRLSPIEGVMGISTHFILKRYKDDHTIFSSRPEQEERMTFC